MHSRLRYLFILLLLLLGSLPKNSQGTDFFFELPNGPKPSFPDFRNQFILHNINKAIANAKRNDPALGKTATSLDTLKPRAVETKLSNFQTSVGFDLKNLTIFNDSKLYTYTINQTYGWLNYTYNLEVKYNAIGYVFTKTLKPDSYNLGVAIHKSFK